MTPEPIIRVSLNNGMTPRIDLKRSDLRWDPDPPHGYNVNYILREIHWRVRHANEYGNELWEFNGALIPLQAVCLIYEEERGDHDVPS